MDIAQESLFKRARNKYMGWRNSRETDFNNSALTAAFKRSVPYDDSTLWFIGTLNEMQHIEHLDVFTLGMMPAYCGDKSHDYNPESAATRTREIAAMLEDDIRLAPLLSSSMFPPLDNLCHLWPIRAVERLTLTNLDSEVLKTLAVSPLIIQYSENPFAKLRPPSSIVPGIEGAHDVVQKKLGMHGLDPEQEMGKMIVEYLLHGKVSHLLLNPRHYVSDMLVHTFFTAAWSLGILH
ncbi:hypothetical protein C8Q73DRAFT_528702 [Cubamyces lactineus]|nr:hypothetical protein C8Q73DRAFT_528702 [Cubamyces lactineus]